MGWGERGGEMGGEVGGEDVGGGKNKERGKVYTCTSAF